MNIHNAKRLLALLESLPESRFDFAVWIGRRGSEYPDPNLTTDDLHSCGTVACMAGWAATLAAQDLDRPPINAREVASVAGDFLGLSNREALDLFLGNWREKDAGGLDSVTLSEAIVHLRSLIEAKSNATPA